MQYSQEHLKTMVYAKFGGKQECIMGNWKIENSIKLLGHYPTLGGILFDEKVNAHRNNLHIWSSKSVSAAVSTETTIIYCCI